VLSLLWLFVFLRLAAAAATSRFRSRPNVVDLLLLGVVVEMTILL
jgi:hypothetical protein